MTEQEIREIDIDYVALERQAHRLRAEAAAAGARATWRWVKARLHIGGAGQHA